MLMSQQRPLSLRAPRASRPPRLLAAQCRALFKPWDPTGVRGRGPAAAAAGSAAEAAAPSQQQPAPCSTHVSPIARAALTRKAKVVAEEVEGKVWGAIPLWLNGSFICNGGGDFTGMNHLADGLSMLSKCRVASGRVFATQQYVHSDTYNHLERTGELGFPEFGTLPGGDAPPVLHFLRLLGRLAAKRNTSDNPSVSVVPLPSGRLLATSEPVTSVFLVNPNTLETVQRVVYDDGVPGDITTAHPKMLADGTLINFTRVMPFGGFHVFKQDPHTLKRTEIAFIRDRDPMSPCWVHDLGVTNRHAVIVEGPLCLNLATSLSRGAVEGWLQLQPEHGTRVHLVPLEEGDGGVRTFHLDRSFFASHIANAYEEGGQVHVDFVGFDDARIMKEDMYLRRFREYPGRDLSSSWLRRLSVPLLPAGDDGDAIIRTLAAPRPLIADESQHGCFVDLPCINPHKDRARHRYVWVAAAVRPTNVWNALAKLDVGSGQVARWHQEGAQPSGPIFVPAPDATSEDDGVLLSIVMSRVGRSFLLVLDAATMRELGRADLPHAVPFRFHGAWLPDDASKHRRPRLKELLRGLVMRGM